MMARSRRSKQKLVGVRERGGEREKGNQHKTSLKGANGFDCNLIEESGTLCAAGLHRGTPL